MAKKRYWIKRSLVPKDINERRKMTTVVSWFEPDPDMITASGKVLRSSQQVRQIGPDDIIETEHINLDELKHVLEEVTDEALAADLEARKRPVAKAKVAPAAPEVTEEVADKKVPVPKKEEKKYEKAAVTTSEKTTSAPKGKAKTVSKKGSGRK